LVNHGLLSVAQNAEEPNILGARCSVFGVRCSVFGVRCSVKPITSCV